jgi:hypothetical protein
VAGTVTLDGDPIEGASLTFTPTAETKAQGGVAATGPDGKYAVMAPQGGKGLAPGKYKVTISRRLRKDGSLPPSDLPPIESDATESLPAKYSSPSQTTLTVTVDGDKPYDFELKSGKKK